MRIPRRDGYKKRNEQDTNLHSTFSLSRERERERNIHTFAYLNNKITEPRAVWGEYDRSTSCMK